MVDDKKRHPAIVDTDALIAVANTNLWPRIRETLKTLSAPLQFARTKRLCD